MLRQSLWPWVLMKQAARSENAPISLSFGRNATNICCEPTRCATRLWIAWVVGAVLAVFATERLLEGLASLAHRLRFSATAFRPTPSVGSRPAVAGDSTGWGHPNAPRSSPQP